MAWRAVWAFLAGAVLVMRPTGAAADTDTDAATPKVEIETAVASDYIYRGVSLSERKPTVRSSIDVESHGFYGFVQFASVSLPNSPAAELSLTGGYRWKFAEIDFDIGANYFYYPGQMLADGTVNLNYWEYSLLATHSFENVGFKDSDLELKGTMAYSPDVSGTGARGAYLEGQVKYEFPAVTLWKRIDWSLIASAGYWRFGNTSPGQGGFPLPSYTNWRVGLAFELNDHVKLDLSYFDTSLSREECFVFTGDTMATPGGIPNALSNPDGLRSRLCGASLVATLSGKFDLSDLMKK